MAVLFDDRYRGTASANFGAMSISAKSEIMVIDPRPIYRSGIIAALRMGISSDRVIGIDSLADLKCTGPLTVILTEAAVRQFGHGSLDRVLNAANPSKAIILFDSQAFANGMAELGAVTILATECGPEMLLEAVASLSDDHVPRQPSEGIGMRKRCAKDALGIETLTFMQYRVLELIGQGLLNKQIAYRCSISEATVKSHASEVFRKLGIRRRSEAAVIFTKMIVSGGLSRLDRGLPTAA